MMRPPSLQCESGFPNEGNGHAIRSPADIGLLVAVLFAAALPRADARSGIRQRIAPLNMAGYTFSASRRCKVD